MGTELDIQSVVTWEVDALGLIGRALGLFLAPLQPRLSPSNRADCAGRLRRAS